MTKQHKHPAAPPAGGPFASLSPLTQDILCVVLLYAVTLVLFRGIVFDNAAFASEGDTAAALSYAHAGAELEKTEKADILWMPYFFSGMPTFGNVAYIPHNVSYLQTAAQKILNLLYLNGKWTWLVVYSFLGGVCMFFLMRVWKFSRPAALLAAMTFMLSPYAVGLAGEGHGSKLMALSYLPLIVLLTHLLFERRDLLSFGLCAVAVGTLMLTNHMQIVYYVLILIALYLLFSIVQDVKERPVRAGTTAALFVGALAVGFLISSYIYLSVYEYAQYSIRGGGTTGSSGGLTLDYATGWSWHPAELLTLLIPGFYGLKADLYWGSMIPWTNSCVYVGLAPLLFSGIALAYRRTRLVLFFAIVTVILLVMSLGRNLSFFYELLFTYLPFFNKFRAPVMILHLLPFATGVMAAAGFTAVADARQKGSGINKEKLVRVVLILAGIIGGLLLLGLAAKNGLFDALSGSLFIKDGEAEQFRQRYGNQAAQAIARTTRMRFDVFWKDYVTFSIIAVALCGVVAVWLKEKIQEWTFAACTVGIVVIDLLIVSSKYVDPKPSSDLEQNFRPDATVAFLQQQPGRFRVFPLGPQLFMDNTYAYHGLESIGGYSPAKLKIYQTMLDSCMYQGSDPQFPLNMNIVNMLNVEYLLVPGTLPEGKFPLVHSDPVRRVVTYRNPGALPRVFFVDTAITATTDLATFRVLNDPTFNAARMAVLNMNLPQPVTPVDSAHRPVILSFASREITIRTETAGPALLVVSEIYYPAGWRAFIDGQETEIYRTNYLLRSILVPPGTHTVLFSFDPPSYRTGWILTNAAWAFAGLCIVVGLWRLPAVRRRIGRRSRDDAEHRG